MGMLQLSEDEPQLECLQEALGYAVLDSSSGCHHNVLNRLQIETVSRLFYKHACNLSNAG